MPDSTPSLHIDDDWKKQAQEEKKRLAEQAEKPKAPPVAPTAAPQQPASAASPRTTREMPQASFATMLQSIVTQALYHLGDLAVRGAEPVVNLDMAKHHIDTLSILEEKTANNLTPEEKRMLDGALYETRMRYISVASQYLGP